MLRAAESAFDKVALRRCATQPENVMKSLATTLLIFVTCLIVAGTMALIDRTQAVLSSSFSANMQGNAIQVPGAGDPTTLIEFAKAAQEQFALPQPGAPVAFGDVRPGDSDYAAAQAVYPFLHRQLLCPECALTSSFSPKNSVTRAQVAVALVSILVTQRKISLLNPEQTSDVLGNVPDADSVSVFARPYIATALANGILTPHAGDMIHPWQPYLRTEMAAESEQMQRRFPASAATASLLFESTGRPMNRKNTR
jgi:S-layer homology domain